MLCRSLSSSWGNNCSWLTRLAGIENKKLISLPKENADYFIYLIILAFGF